MTVEILLNLIAQDFPGVAFVPGSCWWRCDELQDEGMRFVQRIGCVDATYLAVACPE